MKSQIALLAVTFPPLLGVGAFVIPGKGRLPASVPISPIKTIFTIFTASKPQLAPLQAKVDLFNRASLPSETGNNHSGGEASPSERVPEKEKLPGDFREALRNALWDLDDKIHEFLPYDEASAEVDPMYFVHAIQDRLNQIASSRKMASKTPAKSSPAATHSSTSAVDRDVSLTSTTAVTSLQCSAQDVLSKTQAAATATQAPVVEALQEGIKQVPPPPPATPSAVLSSPYEAEKASSASSSPSPGITPGEGGSTTLMYREDTAAVKTRSKRWVEERVRLDRARPGGAPKPALESPPRTSAPVAPSSRDVGAGNAGKRASQPRWRRDGDREEALRRREKVQIARQQRQQELQALAVAEASKPKKEAPASASVQGPFAAEDPPLKVSKPAMEATVAAEMAQVLSQPRNVKRMTTRADRSRGVLVVDGVEDLTMPAATTTVQEAMRQAASQRPKALIDTAEELRIGPLETTVSPRMVTPPSPTLTGAAEEDLNFMPPADRSSVEHILLDSKTAAVEEWHRTRSLEQEMSLEDKVLAVESRLMDEIRAGPSEAILNYVTVLERIGEHQALPGKTSVSEGPQRWDLAYSSLPVSPFLSLPRFLARFLVNVAVKMEGGGKTVVFQAVFKFLEWFPRLRRTQTATVSVLTPRKSVEVMNGRPRFRLGRLFTITQPRLRLPFIRNAKKATDSLAPPELTDTCTYMGAHLKICRWTRSPGVSAEPLLAVFFRGHSPAKNQEWGVEEEGEVRLTCGDTAGPSSSSGGTFGRPGQMPKPGMA